MESVQKMALVPHELLSTLDEAREKAIRRSPAMAQTLNVDAQMKRTLDGDAPLGDDERATKYAQLLRRYRAFSEQSAKRTPIPVQVMTTSETGSQDSKPSPPPMPLEGEVLESVPKVMAHKAALLLQRLKNNPDVQWDDAGQLIFKGVKVKYTNIVDLVNDVLRQRKTSASPMGWQMFAQALALDNVPYELVGNAKRRQYMLDQTRKHLSTPRTPKTKKPKSKAAAAAAPVSSTSSSSPQDWASFEPTPKRQRQSIGKRLSSTGLTPSRWEHY
jgi:hypothetical protein